MFELDRGPFRPLFSVRVVGNEHMERCLEIDEECAAMKSSASVKQQLRKHEPCGVSMPQVLTLQGITRLF